MNLEQRLWVFNLMSRISMIISKFGPIAIVPLLAFKFDNSWLLFGILFSYFGSIVNMLKQWFYIIATIVLFCIGDYGQSLPVFQRIVYHA